MPAAGSLPARGQGSVMTSLNCPHPGCGGRVLLLSPGSSAELLICPQCRRSFPPGSNEPGQGGPPATPSTGATPEPLTQAFGASREQATRTNLTLEHPGPVPAPRPLPERIGRFEIRGVLGEGGFGIVYDAHDPQL